MPVQRTTNEVPLENDQPLSDSIPIWAPLCGNLLLIFGGLLLLPWQKPLMLTAVGGCLIVAGNVLRSGWGVQRT